MSCCLVTDTEGSFMIERASQIADACIKHLKRIAAASTNAEQTQAVCWHAEAMLHIADGAALPTLALELPWQMWLCSTELQLYG